MITKTFCTCHNSCAVVACTKICINPMTRNWDRANLFEKNHWWDGPRFSVSEADLTFPVRFIAAGTEMINSWVWWGQPILMSTINTKCIAQIGPLSFQAAIEHKPRQVRWGGCTLQWLLSGHQHVCISNSRETFTEATKENLKWKTFTT